MENISNDNVKFTVFVTVDYNNCLWFVKSVLSHTVVPTAKTIGL